MQRKRSDLPEPLQKLFVFYDWLPTEHLFEQLTPLWTGHFEVVSAALQTLAEDRRRKHICDGLIPLDDKELVDRYALTMALRFPVPVLESWQALGPRPMILERVRRSLQQPIPVELATLIRTGNAIDVLAKFLTLPLETFSLYRKTEPLYTNLRKLASLSLGPMGLGTGDPDAVAAVSWNTNMFPFQQLVPVGEDPREVEAREKAAAAGATPAAQVEQAPPPPPEPTPVEPTPVEPEPAPPERQPSISASVFRTVINSGTCTFWEKVKEKSIGLVTEAELRDLREEYEDDDEFLDEVRKAMIQDASDDGFEHFDTFDSGYDNENTTDTSVDDVPAVDIADTRLKREIEAILGADTFGRNAI